MIASLVEKSTGREWVDGSAEHGLGQYLNERFESSQTEDYCRAYQQGRWGTHLHPGMYKPGLPAGVRYRRASGSNGSMRLVKQGETLTGILEMPGDLNNHLPATSLRVTLHTGVAYLDVELTIKDKAKDNWPEADWLCLPFRLNSPQFRVARTLGVMDPSSRYFARLESPHVCGWRRIDNHGQRWSERLTLSNGPPLGQSRYARDLEVFSGFCSQEASGLPQPVQQPMEYELPLLVFRHLEFTSTHLVWRPTRRARARDYAATDGFGWVRCSWTTSLKSVRG